MSIRAQDTNTRSILSSFGNELSQLQVTQWTEKIIALLVVKCLVVTNKKLVELLKNEFITEQYLGIIVHKKYRSA